KLNGMLQGVDSNSLCPPSASRRAKTVLRTVFKARLGESPRPHQEQCFLGTALFVYEGIKKRCY
ncbi:MAG TPA: hypothetical protein H9811_05060, partial [Candidatus Gemmiger excrementigallinarum]|nr:hypothetical protein [Candidatus Gemmiger excrementigallinarum]